MMCGALNLCYYSSSISKVGVTLTLLIVDKKPVIDYEKQMYGTYQIANVNNRKAT